MLLSHCAAAGSYGDMERMLQQLQLSRDSQPFTDDTPGQQQPAAPGSELGSSMGAPALAGFTTPMSSGQGPAASGTDQSQTWSETLRALGIRASQDLASPSSAAGSPLPHIQE